MPRYKLDPKRERQRPFHAFEVYRDLGYGRTYRAVARQVDASPGTISHWAKVYKWDERIKENDIIVQRKRDAGAIMPIDDPVAKRLTDIMNKMEAIIDSCFVKEPGGDFSLKDSLKITNAEDLTKIIAEYRKFLETYHKFVAEYMPDKKGKDRSTKIDKLNVFMGDLSQQERIDVMKGIANENASGRNKQPEGRVSEADYTEVLERGNEDRPGRTGVSGSPANSGSRDEETMRES